MNIIEKQFRSLTHITPDTQKKAAFRAVLENRVRADMRVRAAHNAIERVGWTGFVRYIFHAPAFALAIVIIIIGSGSGITFAAQSAVPGQLLYGIKLKTEQVRLALSPGEKRKAALHIEFASRRMNEIEQLVSANMASDTVVTGTVTQYENELNEGEQLLEKNPDAARDIAALLAATESHKNTIRTLKETIAARSHDELDTRLDEAYEHAESQSDAALLTALSSATSSAPAELPKEIVDTSRRKVRSLENKISEKKRAIENARQQPNQDIAAITAAAVKLENAQTIVDTAKTQWEHKDYRASVEQSIQARELIKEASSWNKEDDHRDNRSASGTEHTNNNAQGYRDAHTQEQEHN